MRKLAALLVVLVLVLVWWGSHSPLAPRVETRATEHGASSGRVDVVPPEKSPADAAQALAAVEPQSTGDARSEVSAPPPPVANSRCTIFGRAVDESGKAVAGASVTLSGYPRWTESESVPRLEGTPVRHGYELRTDEDGRFRVETPVPTAETISFTLTPDDFHDLVRLRYGGKRTDDLAALHAGDNDLGTFKLATTGAVSGTVRDRHGAPIAGARVRIGSEPGLTEERDTKSDAVGR